MASRRIGGVTAWSTAARGPATRWRDRVGGLTGVVDVAHRPKFVIDHRASFFCIGSCFARNIEEHLIYRGVEVSSRRIVSPKDEWPRRTNGFVNKFTTHSMRNEVEWMVDPPALDRTFFHERPDGWVDLQLSPHMPAVKLERAVERRHYLSTEYFARLREASVVVITLGLNEAWFDRAACRHLNAAPSFHSTRRDRHRYELHVTDVDENIAELMELRKLILSRNPRARFVVTVSPVPLAETFSGRDVLVANAYSKATLRAAAEAFANDNDDVDYFPAYEMVSMTPRDVAYDEDCLHVSDTVVQAVTRKFVELYLGVIPEPPTFSEVPYLVANPDVEAALRRGEWSSGFEHWQRLGRREGRALAPGRPAEE